MGKREQRLEAGAWLRRQREARGKSVRDIANALGISTQSIYGWEAGDSAPDGENGDKLAAVLNLDVLDLRRRYGLWVPDDTPADIGQRRREERISELRRIADELRATVDELSG